MSDLESAVEAIETITSPVDVSVVELDSPVLAIETLLSNIHVEFV